MSTKLQTTPGGTQVGRWSLFQQCEEGFDTTAFCIRIV